MTRVRQAPLQQYAAQLAAKAAQRAALRSADEVDMGAGGKKGRKRARGEVRTMHAVDVIMH